MNRITQRRPTYRNALRARQHRLILLWVAVLGTSLDASAQGASVSARLQVTARVVSSCRDSTNSLQSAVTAQEGRFSCPTTNGSSTSSNAAAAGASANHTVSDAPGTDGAVKILTLNF